MNKRDAKSAAAAGEPDGLMVFDGTCVFCSRSVRLVLAMDREGRIRFTPMQSPYGRHLAARAGISADDPSTFLFFDCGRALESSEAALALLRRMPAPWRWLAVVGIVPRGIRDAAYGWVARNRYRLFGRRDSCMVPPPDVRARFLEDVPEAKIPGPGG